MKTRPSLPLLVALSFINSVLPAAPGGQPEAPPYTAAQVINALGVDLHAKGTAPEVNALFSPYSIQAALAMTYAGAAGETQAEMARALHYPKDEAQLHQALAALQGALADLTRRTAERAGRAKNHGGPSEPVTLTIANRLFGQQDYDFRAPFLALTKDTYGAPFQPMDFKHQWEAERVKINGWVEEQTRQRIRDLILPDGLSKETRLVLANAIYLKAPWAEEFPVHATKPAPFNLRNGAMVKVPTMVHRDELGYSARDGFAVVAIPYSGGDLQFLILLPDTTNSLAILEATLTAELLTSVATPGVKDVILHLPKFKLEPPLMKLGEVLQTLGMKTAFDKPEGSANFDRLAPRKPNDYLFISEVFHKTFLELDEKGTEAAAATAVVMMRPTSIAIDPPKPVEVKVDRPFLFAIQHRPTGACLFLGRVVDPR